MTTLSGDLSGLDRARPLQAICPIPPRISPHADGVQTWLTDWMGRLVGDGSPHLAAGGFARYAGRLYPTATATDLRTLAALFTWFFLLDDAWDGPPAQDGPTGADDGGRQQLRRARDEVLAILRAGPDTLVGPGTALTGPLREVLVEAWRPAYERLSPPARLRFVDAVAHHLDGVIVETVNKATGRRPTVAEYVELRRATSAAYVSYALIEFATGVSLPDSIHAHPVVREICAAANDLLSWFNDVLSLERDTVTAGGHNLVLAVAYEAKLPVDAAIRAVELRWRRRMRRFTQLRAAVPAFGPAIDGPLREHLDGVANSVRGTIDWSLESARYRALPDPPPA